MLSEVSVFIAAGQRKMNTFVTRNTKVGNSVPVAKKTDGWSGVNLWPTPLYYKH